MTTIRFHHGQHKIAEAFLTWAGICPWTKSYCFGSESGRIALSLHKRRDFSNANTLSSKNIAVTSASVNGCAFLGPFAAVSSRHEIVVLRSSSIAKSHFRPEPVLTHENGAHGVIAVESLKAFLAPIGNAGLVRIVVSMSGKARASVLKAEDRGLNFYKVTPVVTDGDKVLIAAACRSGGIAAFWVTQGTAPSTISRHVFGKADIVDIAAVGDSRNPRGVIGLGKDGSLVWIADVLGDESPRTISPRIGIDTAYSLLLIEGHGVILASESLSCLPELANGLMINRESIDGFRRNSIDCLPLYVPDAPDQALFR